MSKLEELIQELCPDGVEYKTFGSTCNYVRGITYSKNKETNAEENAWRVLRANNITLSSNTLNYSDIKLISNSVKVKDEQLLSAGDILICAGSGSKEHIGKVAYIFSNMDFTFGGFMAVIRCHEQICSRFMFHILTSSMFTNHLASSLNSSTINNLNATVIDKFTFPVPPLPIQQEIVRILDTFTALEAELKAELEAELARRKVQYEYYRSLLIESSSDCREMKLAEIFDMKAGKSISAADISDTQTLDFLYPCYGGNGLRGYVQEATHNRKALIIGRQGALCGNVKRVEGDFYPTEHAVVVSPKRDINIDWAFHVLSAINLNQYATKSAQPGLSVKKIEQLSIPIPPLLDQARIVAILDRFDALVNDITQGLPAEIAARRKQYEYYRDKLLTFPRKEAEQ